MRRIEVQIGDITRLAVDAIVNAANSGLAGGGGVDGAIHQAAGFAELRAACARIGGCPVGQVRLTPGFRLPAEAIIHTVGPVWRGGDTNEDALLANCYRNVLGLAADRGFRSVAFPAISCGAYGFPAPRAVSIAVREVRSGLAVHPVVERVIFCCFDEAMAAHYREQLHATEPNAAMSGRWGSPS